jgi:hypothetical protein
LVEKWLREWLNNTNQKLNNIFYYNIELRRDLLWHKN